MGTCGTLLVVVVGLTQFISFFVDKQNGKVLMPYIGNYIAFVRLETYYYEKQI